MTNILTGKPTPLRPRATTSVPSAAPTVLEIHHVVTQKSEPEGDSPEKTAIDAVSARVDAVAESINAIQSAMTEMRESITKLDRPMPDMPPMPDHSAAMAAMSAKIDAISAKPDVSFDDINARLDRLERAITAIARSPVAPPVYEAELVRGADQRVKNFRLVPVKGK